MTDDAVRRIARARLIEASADIELQLEKTAGLRPMVIVLAKARRKAVEANDMLIGVDPEDAKSIRALQNEIRRYEDLVQFTREIVLEGKAADREMAEDERDEIAVLMSTPEGRAEAEALGIEDEGQD